MDIALGKQNTVSNIILTAIILLPQSQVGKLRNVTRA